MAASVVPLLVTRILPFLLLSGLEVFLPGECPAKGTASVTSVLEHPHKGRRSGLAMFWRATAKTSSTHHNELWLPHKTGS